MERVFQEYLFKKHIFVKARDQEEEPHAFEVIFSLASLFKVSRRKKFSDTSRIRLPDLIPPASRI